jgi:hypothetical protein
MSDLILPQYFGGTDSVTDTDYQFSRGVKKLPKPPYRFKDLQIKYYQDAINHYACSLFGPIGAISALTGHVFLEKDQKDIFNLAVTKGLDPKVGWDLSAGVDLLRKETLRLFNIELKSFVMTMGSDEFFEWIDAGYNIVGGLYGNKEYNLDIKDNGILDKSSWGKSTYGHIVSFMAKDKIYLSVLDSFKNNGHQTYDIKRSQIKQMVLDGVLFRNCYGYVVKADYDALNVPGSDIWSKVPLWATKSVQKAINKGITNWENPDEIVGNDEDERVWYILKGVNTLKGNLSKVRLIKAMDNLGLLDN